MGVSPELGGCSPHPGPPDTAFAQIKADTEGILVVSGPVRTLTLLRE